MKKLIISACLILFAFAFTTEKKFTLTEGQTVLLWKALQTAQKAIPNSESVTAKEANEALLSIDTIQKVLIQQARDTTKK